MSSMRGRPFSLQVKISESEPQILGFYLKSAVAKTKMMCFKARVWTLLAHLLPLVVGQHVSYTEGKGRPTCTVHSGQTNTTDDVPSILEAFERCGRGGNIVFLQDETYHINSRLNPVVNDVNIEWRGEWLVGLRSLHEGSRNLESE